MISFLASPKRFEGEFRRIQDLAIASWLAVHPDVEIMLFGNDPGTAEAANRHRVRHVPEVKVSPSGAPYFDSIAAYADQYARYDGQIYLNCDILMPPNLLSEITAVTFPQFLVVGQRIDLDQGMMFDVSTKDWIGDIRRLWMAGKAKLQSISGVDYFGFPRGLWNGISPLIIGRGGYDAALLAFCLRRNIPIVDGSWRIPAVHQNHSYSHIAGDKQEAHKGAEAQLNIKTHDICHSSPDIGDADWKIENGTVQFRSYRGDLVRWVELRLRYNFDMKYPSYLIRLLWRVLQCMHIGPQRERTLADILP